MLRCDVVVIGAGIIGCAIARAVARSGSSVIVLERRAVGAESSGAAAGMLGVQGETEDEVMLRLGARSRALFPGLLQALREETGREVEFWSSGTLFLAFGEEDRHGLEARRRWQRTAGFDSEWLDRAAALALEPRLHPRLEGAVLFRADARVDNRALTHALAQSAARAGAAFHSAESARSLVLDGGRVGGVETDQHRIACDVVVNAAGAWAGRLPGGTPIPIRPVRGQIVVVQDAKPPFRHAIYSPRGYAVARRDGRVLLGSTREEAGFEKRVTAAGVAKIVRSGLELAPALAELPLREFWSGLRPASVDGRPVIGEDPSVPGHYFACGHFRNGVLLAPLTAEIVDDLIRGRARSDIGPLRPERFTAAATDDV
jgi:glycine oxidase